MFVGILVITLVGLSFNYILIGLEKYFTAWKHNPSE